MQTTPPGTLGRDHRHPERRKKNSYEEDPEVFDFCFFPKNGVSQDNRMVSIGTNNLNATYF